MIYTTYFAKLNKLPSDVIPISICGKAPDWYKGIQYKKLAPKYDFFMKWKENHDNNYYIKCFNEQVLNTLNPYRVLEEIHSLLPQEIKDNLNMANCPFWVNPDFKIALVCYEKPTDFCHRHLVADWFNKSGIEAKEYQF